uniref:CMRF35-like molecule 1 n=1 Tax=Sinocyclocheilus rhinocerous TaxID=307959 RepID=A0A673MHW7_9TELE
MWSFLLLWSCMRIVVVGAQKTVIGHRGGRFDIRCPYESGYESNPKYFCKGECKFGNKFIMVKSGSPAKDQRFSLSDDTTARVFTVTITDLRTEDEGQYWCGVERILPDVYSEILLLVKQDKRPAEVTTISLCLITSTRVLTAPLTHQTLLAQTPPPDSGKHLSTSHTLTCFSLSCVFSGSFVIIIIITAGGLVLLLICAVLLIVAIRKKMMCGLVSFSAEGLHLRFRKGEENTYETENAAVVSNSHTAQSNDVSEAADTDLDYMNAAAAAVRNSVNPELNTSRHSHIYQSLTADSQEESVYHCIHQSMD